MHSGGEGGQQTGRGHGGSVLGHGSLSAELVGSEDRLVHEVEGARSGQFLGFVATCGGVGFIAA